MKMLRDHKLLIDTACPLCRAYSATFEACGLLEKDSVMPYEVGKDTFECLDAERAKNQIALVNAKTGAAMYGIDSLVKILGHSFGVIQRIAAIAWIHAVLKRLYSFISYNRKVIVPSNNTSCYPSYHLKYRLLFIIMASLFSSYVLYKYSFKLEGWVRVQGYERELLLSFGQLVFQAFFLLRMPVTKIVDYLGNLTAVSLIGSLLLVLILAIGGLAQMPSLGYALCFGGVVGLIFLEHWRRILVLGLPMWLCLTWVVYRSLLLLLYI